MQALVITYVSSGVRCTGSSVNSGGKLARSRSESSLGLYGGPTCFCSSYSNNKRGSKFKTCSACWHYNVDTQGSLLRRLTDTITCNQYIATIYRCTITRMTILPPRLVYSGVQLMPLQAITMLLPRVTTHLLHTQVYS